MEALGREEGAEETKQEGEHIERLGDSKKKSTDRQVHAEPKGNRWQTERNDDRQGHMEGERVAVVRLLPNGPVGNSALFQGHVDDPLEELMDAYCSHFGLQQYCVQLRFRGIGGEVALQYRVHAGDVFHALHW